jgi:selenocysteine lyase/cysteine desulfurase
MRQIHLNTAGAGLMSARTLDTMVRFLEEERAFGAYEAELRHAQELSRARECLARLLGAKADDIAFFDSGTRAWNTLLGALPPLPPGSRLWVTPFEYAGNLLELQRLTRGQQLKIEMVPLGEDGGLDLTWMATHLDDTVRLLSVVHVPSACGAVLPIELIGALVAAAGHRCVYMVDACQSVGQLPLDVRCIGCDILTAAGRKFLCGPRGTGFAYVSPRCRALVGDHAIDVHAARVDGLDEHDRHETGARRFELSELSPALLLGLGSAVAQAETRFDQAQGAARAELYSELCERLSMLPSLRLLRPGTSHAGIATVVPRDRSPAELVRQLRERRIAAWDIDGAHTPLYMGSEGVPAAVRFSLHHHNTQADLDALMHAIDDLCKG